MKVLRESRELDGTTSSTSPGGPSRAEGMLMDGRGYLAVLARRKWIIIPIVLLLPLAAYIVSSRIAPVYEASGQVYLNRQSQTLSGLEDPLIFQPERVISTQADIARLPVIAKRVVDKADNGMSSGEFLSQSSVMSSPDVDLLTFNVRDGEPETAITLANLYAQEYIAFRRKLDTKALREAAQAIERQLASLEARGLGVNSSLYGALSQKLQQLQSAQVLQESNALLVERAEGAGQVEPQPLRTAALALAFAIALGLGFAFLAEALDTRVRDPEELADLLGLPLLGSLPEPSSGRSRGRVVMIDQPNSSDAEMFRMLRTSLEVTALQGGCRSIMITSALAKEGKSTMAANLAVAFARAGRRVVLVDLDLRRPSLGRFFDLGSRPGITDLVQGRATIGDAGARITFGDALEPMSAGVRRLRVGGRAEMEAKGEPGVLDVIGSGELPRNPGEFMVTPELDATLDRLLEDADLLLVDGPPLLLAGDALTLTSKVDALLLVSRMNAFRRGQVRELERLLAASPTVKLGFVATGHTSMPRRDYYGAEGRSGEPRRVPAAQRSAPPMVSGPETDEVDEIEAAQSSTTRRSWT